jgi:hypothetical protein
VDSQLAQISGHVGRLYADALAPVAARFSFERGPSLGEVSGPPSVLLIGNHSSGKSSFINHLLGLEVQQTGLAPTDDAFSILSYGPEDAERDGHALVSDPSLPYDGLGQFGPVLVSHARQRLRPHPLLQTVTLIDSPGMIDAAGQDSNRGYDFAGVVRWFAERADLVLLFFDPDKPGTTGETLDVFTRSLLDLDHKLRVVMNKVDRFEGTHDFARAYGTLCWNLGKVSPRKDLPLVYTTYTPIADAPEPGLPAEDFDASREALHDEIRRTPRLRLDNILTRLHQDAQRLRVHAQVAEAAGKELRARRLAAWGWLVFGGVAGAAATGGSVAAEAEVWLSVVLGALTVGGVVAGRLGVLHYLERVRAAQLGTLGELFERVYARELLLRDRADDLRARWGSVQERTHRTLSQLGAENMPRLKGKELTKLSAVIDDTVPSLRREIHGS